MPDSDQGFVVIAIDDCSFLLDRSDVKLKSGQHKTIPGTHPLSLSQSGEVPTSLVIVNVVSASQSLTFEETSLPAHQTLEDASGRNATLILATAPLALIDVRDQNAEDEPWKSGPHKQINLRKGEYAWLAPGIHRLRNVGHRAANFVSVEW